MIADLFSKRQKKLRGETPDVFQYKEIPRSLRVQIVHIWRDVFGRFDWEHWGYRNSAAKLFDEIHSMLCREYGLFELPSPGDNSFERIANYFLACTDLEQTLDIIELTFRAADTVVRNDGSFEARQAPDAAIEELNSRFREHGVGYEFGSGELIRVDSQLIHSEAVKPALTLLREKSFKGANDEFLAAFEHYRHGRFAECINECLKAFESTLKIICAQRRWNLPDNATAKKLVDVCLDHKLVPEFLQTQFSALRTVLESGIPTGRNKLTSHGRGTADVSLPPYFAAYILHLTASTVLFLCEANKAHP